MDWTNDLILDFLRKYKAHECLWNPKCEDKTRSSVRDAWYEIWEEMEEKLSVEELKRKRDSLMAYYRHYRTKMRKRASTGAEEKTSWFAFDLMHSFLKDVYECKHPVENNPHLESTSQPKISQNVTRNLQRKRQLRNSNEEDTRSDVSDDDSNIHVKKQKTMSIPLNQNAERMKYQTKAGKQIKDKSAEEQKETKQRQSRKQKINEAIGILIEESKRDEEADDIELFGKFIVKKLRNLPEDRRDRVMFKMHSFLYETEASLRMTDVVADEPTRVRVIKKEVSEDLDGEEFYDEVEMEFMEGKGDPLIGDIADAKRGVKL